MYKKSQVLLAIILFSVGAALGTIGSISLPLGLGVTGFWPAVIVQVAGGIWLGALGVLVGALFPFISNTYAGAPLIVSFLYLPSNIVQGLIPYLVFRYLDLDPALRSLRSLIHFLWSGVFVNNALGALLATSMIMVSGLHIYANPFLFARTWFLGNTIPILFIGPPTLMILSPLLERIGVIPRRSP